MFIKAYTTENWGDSDYHYINSQFITEIKFNGFTPQRKKEFCCHIFGDDKKYIINQSELEKITERTLDLWREEE